jgi:hypothetical protein
MKLHSIRSKCPGGGVMVLPPATFYAPEAPKYSAVLTRPRCPCALREGVLGNEGIVPLILNLIECK